MDPVFSSLTVLQPILTKVIQSSKDPDERLNSLVRLREEILPLSERILDKLWDFILDPLLLVVENSVPVRAESALIGAKRLKACAKSLSCLEFLFSKCKGKAGSQVHMLLPRLTSLILLFQESSCDENLCIQTLSCLLTSLEGANPCLQSACLCSHARTPPKSKYGAVCSVAHLRSPAMAVPVGHMLSLTLQIADEEAQKGHKGSRSIREKSLAVLRALIQKVRTPSALSFFLPGVVSGLFRAILAPSRRPGSLAKTKSDIQGAAHSLKSAAWNSTGAAGSSQAVCEATVAMKDLVVFTMADHTFVVVTAESSLQTEASWEAASLALQNLSLRGRGRQNEGGEQRETAPSPGTASRDESGSAHGMSVERSEEWRATVGAHLHTILTDMLPLLCEKGPANVQLSVLEMCHSFLLLCTSSLRFSRPLLLECVLTLKHSPHAAVSATAQRSLDCIRVSDSSSPHSHEGQTQEEGSRDKRGDPMGTCSVPLSTLQGMLSQALQALSASFTSGADARTSMPARLIAALLQLAGPANISALLLLNSELLTAFMACMRQSFQFSSKAALVVELSVTPAAGREPIRGEVGDSSFEALPTVLLVKDMRMSDKMAAVHTDSLFQDLVRVLHVVGAVAVQDPAGTALHCACSPILDALSALSVPSDSSSPASIKALAVVGMDVDMDTGEQHRSAASMVLVLNHILVGALEGSSAALPEALLALIDRVVQEYTCPAVMGQPRHSLPSSRSREGGMVARTGNHALDLDAINSSALFAKMRMEGIGLLAMGLGKAVLSSPSFLRLTLRPLLVSLASPNASLASAAHSSLLSICRATGHSTVAQLVRHNSDYVVDAVCACLRQLDDNPVAPALLRAVILHSGAGLHMLTLLKEPVRSVLRRLRVTVRHRSKQHILTFTQALCELSRSMVPEAARLRDGADEGGASTSDRGSSTRERRAFQAMAELSEACLDSVAALVLAKDLDVKMAALDTVQAAMAVMVELHLLSEKWSRERSQKEAQRLSLSQEAGESDDDAEPDAEDSLSSQLLPRVHQLWPILMSSLRSQGAKTVVRALEVVQRVTESGGGVFMSARVRDELWPVLAHMISHGCPLPQPDWTGTQANPLLTAASPQPSLQLRLGGPDNALTPVSHAARQQSLELEKSQAAVAPVSRLRLQHAALACLAQLAECEVLQPAVEPILRPACALAASLLCQDDLLDVCCRLLLALGRVNPDAVWLLLADTVTGKPFEASNVHCCDVAARKRKSSDAYPGLRELTLQLQPWTSPEGSLLTHWLGAGKFSPVRKWCGHAPTRVLLELMKKLEDVV